MNQTSLLTIGLVLLGVAACNDTPDVTSPEPHSGPLRVHTSTRALAALARRIGGDAIEVTCPVPTGNDPIWWRPNPMQTTAFQRADLILLNGAQLEKWVRTVSLPDNRTVRTAEGFSNEWLRFEKEVRHRHGPKGEHVHKDIDGHTWLDPILASKQAAAIATALKKRLPDHAAAIDAAAAAVSGELAEIDTGFRALAMKGKQLTQPAPVWNYVVHRYGWTLVDEDASKGAIVMPAPTADSPAESMRALLKHLTTATER